jgi:DNA-binding transcriptional regulator/RsmH inhibitor MraZ
MQPLCTGVHQLTKSGVITQNRSMSDIAIYHQLTFVGSFEILKLWTKDHLEQKRPETVVSDAEHAPNDHEDIKNHLCP